MSTGSSRPRVTDADIAASAAVNQSTVSRWTRRKGFPTKAGKYRDREEVVAFLDGVPIPQNRLITDGAELAQRLSSAGVPEQRGSTYGDRLRASWNLTRRDRAPACATEPARQVDEAWSRAVAREVKRSWNLPIAGANGLAPRRPALFGLAALLVVHHRLGRWGAKHDIGSPRSRFSGQG